MLDGMNDSSNVLSPALESSMIALHQSTLKSTIHCNGVGLHSGKKISLAMIPAAPDTGIVFRRTDVIGEAGIIQARYDNVVDTRMNTTLGNEDGTTIGTVEHLMAAISGCGIDNLIIELNGPEVPVMDGSSEPFVFLIECAGIEAQNAPRRAIMVKCDVSIQIEGCEASLSPANTFSISCDINFDSPVIGHQELYLEISNDSFRQEISRARTFGFVHEVEMLRKMGLAKGASLDNAIGINGDEIMNEGGLRFDDEFVRHKVLDCIGDLALAGAPLLGHFRGVRGGHASNNALLRELFSSTDNWAEVTFDQLHNAMPLAMVANG